MSNTTFNNLYNYSSNGGGVYCNCKYINVTGCTFNNLTTLSGSGLYLDLYDTSTDSIVQTSTFTSNNALYGGAIYIYSINVLNISSNTFYNNAAKLVDEVTSLKLLVY